MWTIPKTASLTLAALLSLPATLLAKRIPAPGIEPIVHRGVRYTVPNDKGTVGYVVASDVGTGKELWRKTLFRKLLNPVLEHDVQWVFVRQMRLEGERLILVTEGDRVYSLDLKTRRVKRLKQKPTAQQRARQPTAPAGQPASSRNDWRLERQPAEWRA